MPPKVGGPAGRKLELPVPAHESNPEEDVSGVA